jgi:hypothetical protein
MYRIHVKPDMNDLRKKMRAMYEEEKDIRNKRKIILISDIDKKDHFYKK